MLEIALPVLYGQLACSPFAGNGFEQPSAGVRGFPIPVGASSTRLPLYRIPLGLPGAAVRGFSTRVARPLRAVGRRPFCRQCFRAALRRCWGFSTPGGAFSTRLPLFCFPLGLPGAPVCGHTCVAIRAWLDARGYTCVVIRAWLYAHGCTCVAIRTRPHVHCWTHVAIRVRPYVRGYTCVASSTRLYVRGFTYVATCAWPCIRAYTCVHMRALLYVCGLTYLTITIFTVLKRSLEFFYAGLRVELRILCILNSVSKIAVAILAQADSCTLALARGSRFVMRKG